MQSLRPVLVFLAACSTSTPAPKPTTASGSAPTSDAESGAFVIHAGGKVVANETFSFTRQGANTVLHVKQLGVADPENQSVEGELELDAKYRPVRADYRHVTPADADKYKLGGTPLTLEMNPEDTRDPQRVIATVPTDVYVAGPGFAAMTPLCSLVTRDVLFNTLGDKRSFWPQWLEAYRGAPVGRLQRIVVDSADLDFELLCDGPRLVAGGLATLELWFVRKGRDADLAALQAAPRPTEHAWKHPVDEAEPWDPLHTFLFPDAGIIVTRDMRTRRNRLTTFSITDGKEVAHRDFTLPLEAHVMCEQLPGARLVCANAETKLLEIIDAKTLTKQTDLFPSLAATNLTLAGGSRRAGTVGWRIMYVDGKRLLIDRHAEDEQAVEIDLETQQAKVIPLPENHLSRRTPLGPTACPSSLGNPVVVGDSEWSIDQTSGTATLVRKKKKGGATLPAIVLPFDHPSLLDCKPKSGGAYIITFDGDKSVLGLLAPDGKLRWRTTLVAHPRDPDIVGGTMVLTTPDQNRRVLGIDTATGKILWVASGPLPKT